MDVRFDVKVTGLRGIQAKLAGLEVQAEKAVDKAMEDGAGRILEVARRRAPYRTGDLVRSLDMEKHGRTWFVGSDLWRAHFAEFGTRNHAAQPFLGPALEQEAKGIVNDVRSNVLAVLRRAGRL